MKSIIMENANQEKSQSEELKISPLGTDEINSVIKSFKNSSFNQEELYKKDEKNFVKKSLFDLAKESEKMPPKENDANIDIGQEQNHSKTNVDVNQEIIKEPDQKNDLNNTHSSDDLDNNSEKQVDQVEGSVDETITSVEAQEEKIDYEHKAPEKIIEEDVNNPNSKVSNKNLNESDKIEYEEKTLEALDSVREAVTKSLEENNETQDEEIDDKVNDKTIVSNDILSEINLINTIFKNIREISNEEIENTVKSKVIELAEEVIGFKIEKFPDKFLKKIKNSIDDIKSINKDIKIYLNDIDFELLNKFVEKNEPEIYFKLASDPSLGRGDFTIDMGGVIQAIKYKKVIE